MSIHIHIQTHTYTHTHTHTQVEALIDDKNTLQIALAQREDALSKRKVFSLLASLVQILTQYKY
jgi:hypothetical protein